MLEKIIGKLFGSPEERHRELIYNRAKKIVEEKGEQDYLGHGEFSDRPLKIHFFSYHKAMLILYDGETVFTYSAYGKSKDDKYSPGEWERKILEYKREKN